MIFAVRSMGATCALLFLTPLFAAEPEPARLPVREVTIFKDGYAFVSREGSLPVGANGTAVLDELPVPVLGTFWAYSADKSVTVRAVTAKRVETQTVRDAASVRELLEANVGANVIIRDTLSNGYTAKIVALRGLDLVLLQSEAGLRLVQISKIAEVALATDAPKLTVTDTGTRPQLSLSLGGAKPGGTATLGVTYLQSGLRWIPGYKIVLNPATNTAKVSLQATLVNDLADMENVSANLVIGAPQWDFKNTTDPLVLQETLVQVYRSRDDASSYRLSNAITSQVGGFGGGAAASAPMAMSDEENAPQVSGSESKEDFFVFAVKNVNLKRGERMVIPVTEFTLSYTDVFKLELAPTPPQEWQQAYSNGSANALSPELAALLAAPKVKHYIRFKNTSAYPITTAPVLLFSGDRVLSQSTLTYTAKNAETDLFLASASNISLARTDKETGRVPDAKKWNGYSFEQVSLAGTITLTNYGAKPAALEVTRYVIGTITETSPGGTADTLDLFGGTDAAPSWWRGYSLPNGLERFNGLGRAVWKVTVPAGKPVNLSYSWRYLWRY